MRILVVGAGSMGKRRTRILRQLGFNAVTVFDNRPDRRLEIADKYEVKVHNRFEDALSEDPEVLFICVPPHLHARYIKTGLEQELHVFCEAPLVLDPDVFDEVVELARKSNSVLMPSCTYLHNYHNRKVQNLLIGGELGAPLALIIHSGLHVQDWHPYEDYRKFYAADRSKGGMCIDVLVHEFQLARFLVGEVERLSCFARRRADVEGTIGFDIYDILVDFSGGVSGVIHNDMVQRPWGLYRKLMGDQGTVIWDWSSLRLHKAVTGTWSEDKPPPGWNFEEMYANEIRHFFEVVSGKTDLLYPLEEEGRILRIVLEAERSSREERHVQLKF